MSKQIFLTGIVDQYMAEDLRFNLMNSSEKVIDVYVSCLGGDVNKGFEMANLIQGIQAGGKKDIHTYNLAHADSIATVIFLAADQDKRHVVDSSTLFTHNPRFMQIQDVTTEDAVKAAKELEIQTNRIADFYVKNIEGLDKEEAFSLMNNETNMTAGKMLEYSIVSEVMESFAIAAKRGLITNQNTNKMGLFKNKAATFATKINDGSVLLHEGELRAELDVAIAGEAETFTGDLIDEEGRTIKIKDGVVIEIVEAEVLEEEADAAAPATDAVEIPVDEAALAVVDQVANILADFKTEMTGVIDQKFAAIRKEGSKQLVPKVENTKQPIVVNSQTSARQGVKAMMDEIAKGKREERQTN